MNYAAKPRQKIIVVRLGPGKPMCLSLQTSTAIASSNNRSMSRRRNCRDNAPMERCFRSLKTELPPPLDYETVGVAREDLGRYLLRYYNWKRPHQAYGVLVPERAEQQLKMVPSFYCPLQNANLLRL